ncbi:MAG: hypothetical protein FJ010_01245 [Chloroflexi bacterium]|nr:hypothetical protein [Chloroflexota bacterium]
MTAQEVNPVVLQVISERNQNHDTRERIFVELEAIIDRPVVTLFTSFVYPVMLEDSDVDMLAGILQNAG